MDDVDVVLHFSVNSLAKALDYFYELERSFNEDGSLTLTMKIDKPAEASWLLSILLSFGDGVEVIEPPELRQLIKTNLEKTLKRYS